MQASHVCAPGSIPGNGTFLSTPIKLFKTQRREERKEERVYCFWREKKEKKEERGKEERGKRKEKKKEKRKENEWKQTNKNRKSMKTLKNIGKK